MPTPTTWNKNTTLVYSKRGSQKEIPIAEYDKYISAGWGASAPAQNLAPVPSGDVPTTPTTTPTPPISPKIISPEAKGTYADVYKGAGEKTIYTKTGEAFQTPEQLSKYLGISTAPEWSKIGEKLVSTEETFKPPEPTANNIIEDYTSSMLSDVEKKKTVLEEERKKQLEETQRKMDETQKKIDEWTSKQEKTLEEAKPLAEPFREEKEKTERERLKVEENYFENQKLVEELDTLLTDIKTQVQAEKARTGLASIRNPRIQKAAEEASARVGVIEAVMASRNNQITMANNLIDRSVQAITADRKDRLSYYNTLLDFYSKEKDEDGKKLFNLTQKETKFINDNITMLEANLASAQKNADYIKGLMLDPSTAGIVAKSGVTLNDNPEQVMAKFANYEYSQEVSQQVSKMSEDGYQILSTPQAIASKNPADLVRLTDSKGAERVYYKKPADKLLSPSEAATLGVPYGTTEKQAAAMGITPARWKGSGGETTISAGYNLTTPEGISMALSEGMDKASIRAWLDTNTKLTVGSINDLIKSGEELAGSDLGKINIEINKVAQQLVNLGAGLNDLNYSVAITNLINKFGFDETSYDSFASAVNQEMERISGTSSKPIEEKPIVIPTPTEAGIGIGKVIKEVPSKVFPTISGAIGEVGKTAGGFIQGLISGLLK